MAHHPGSRPYVARWVRDLPGDDGGSGDLSAHGTVGLAQKAARRQRDALRPMWGAYKPLFYYQVIDSRDGSVVAFIPG